MFERFTDKARRAVVLCQEEARRYNHHSIGTDHLLLALTYEGTVAYQVLVYLGADFEKMRADVVAATGEGLTPAAGHIPFTVTAKCALELAVREAIDQGVDYVAAEHLLLGLLRSGEGTGADVLAAHGITHGAVREQVAHLTGAAFHGAPPVLYRQGENIYPTRKAAEAAGPEDVAEVVVELHPGEAFAVYDQADGYHSADFYLDFAHAHSMLMKERDFSDHPLDLEIVVMSPVVEDVAALDAQGRRLILGVSKAWGQEPLTSRLKLVRGI